MEIEFLVQSVFPFITNRCSLESNNASLDCLSNLWDL